jgi:hypothetical protein
MEIIQDRKQLESLQERASRSDSREAFAQKL